MIPQDTRDTLRIGFKSGSVIEVKVEDGKNVIASCTTPSMPGVPIFRRGVIGDAMVDFAEVEFMQVVPNRYPELGHQALLRQRQSLPPYSLRSYPPPDYSRNRQEP